MKSNSTAQKFETLARDYRTSRLQPLVPELGADENGDSSATYYPARFVEQARDVRTSTYSYGGSNEVSVDYVVVGDQLHGGLGEPLIKTDIVINGFTEGLVANGNLALSHAVNGGRMLITEQYQGKTPKPTDEFSPVTYQAMGYLSVLIDSGLAMQEGSRFITHSYGSNILQEMLRLNAEYELNMPCFEGLEVQAFAPVGLIEGDSVRKFAPRFIKSLIMEASRAGYYDQEVTPSPLMAGIKSALKNPIRRTREAFQVARSSADLGIIALKASNLQLYSMPDDKMLPRDSIFTEGLLRDIEAAQAINPDMVAGASSPFISDVESDLIKTIGHIEGADGLWFRTRLPKKYARQMRKVALSETAGHNDLIKRTLPMSRMILSNWL